MRTYVPVYPGMLGCLGGYLSITVVPRRTVFFSCCENLHVDVYFWGGIFCGTDFCYFCVRMCRRFDHLGIFVSRYSAFPMLLPKRCENFQQSRSSGDIFSRRFLSLDLRLSCVWGEEGISRVRFVANCSVCFGVLRQQTGVKETGAQAQRWLVGRRGIVRHR